MSAINNARKTFVPFVKMYAGYRSGHLRMVAGTRIFNRAKIDAEVKDAFGVYILHDVS